MKLAVVAFPNLDETDRQWIEAVRAQHDPLVPHQGADRMRDIPYVPHMTVAAAPDVESAGRLAGELKGHARTVRGTISCLDLVDVGSRTVKQVASLKLGSHGQYR